MSPWLTRYALHQASRGANRASQGLIRLEDLLAKSLAARSFGRAASFKRFYSFSFTAKCHFRLLS